MAKMLGILIWKDSHSFGIKLTTTEYPPADCVLESNRVIDEVMATLPVVYFVVTYARFQDKVLAALLIVSLSVSAVAPLMVNVSA